MITSYRGSVSIAITDEFISDEQVPHLFHLVRLGLSARERLKVNDFDDFFPGKDVMITTDTLLKTEPSQQIAKRFELNVGV